MKQIFILLAGVLAIAASASAVERAERRQRDRPGQSRH